MAVTSALRAGLPLPSEKFLSHFFIGRNDPRATMRLQRICQMKNPITSKAIEPAKLLIYEIVSQLITLPRAPFKFLFISYITHTSYTIFQSHPLGVITKMIFNQKVTSYQPPRHAFLSP
jgi:hypothetical protein